MARKYPKSIRFGFDLIVAGQRKHFRTIGKATKAFNFFSRYCDCELWDCFDGARLDA